MSEQLFQYCGSTSQMNEFDHIQCSLPKLFNSQVDFIDRSQIAQLC